VRILSAVSLLLVAIWFTDQGADMRRGHTLALGWESWVRGRSRWHKDLHIGFGHYLATVIFLGTGAVSAALGVTFSFTNAQRPGDRHARNFRAWRICRNVLYGALGARSLVRFSGLR
jgi:hypothetical protein